MVRRDFFIETKYNSLKSQSFFDFFTLCFIGIGICRKFANEKERRKITTQNPQIMHIK
jgi:hypothetical protein